MRVLNPIPKGITALAMTAALLASSFSTPDAALAVATGTIFTGPLQRLSSRTITGIRSLQLRQTGGLQLRLS